MVTQFYKIGSEIWRPKNMKIWGKFRTIPKLDRENLWNKTRYCGTENDENFGPETAKNTTGVSTDLTHWHYVCHV